ncbi:glutathione hydrolase-like YwrD proenzyme [Amphiura filiformis]|uniref:glutathione hydrolase-like YwrD proenzyme n=1 Tax=Amphiura filiformis TaxID=82378 RepID=UPI003B218748
MSNDTLLFRSRRSPVLSLHGCVASGQPIASQVGVEILKAGGNAADAAVGVAAALNVTQPCSNGIGGDCFCLFYDAKTKTVKGINGSGRAPAKLSLDLLKERGFSNDNPVPNVHALNITIPGAAAGLVDTWEQFGSKKVTLEQVLEPAIKLAETGYPVHEIAAAEWQSGSHVDIAEGGSPVHNLADFDWPLGTTLLTHPGNPHGKAFLIDGRAPKHGEVIKLPLLAQTYRELATHGKKSFYEGRRAQAIVDIVQANGGVITLEDLKQHTSTMVEPISVSYKGVRLWEIPPNGQGITALIALNILDEMDLKGMEHNSPQYLHHLIEAFRLSFTDALQYCADPEKANVPIEELLSKRYAAKRRQLIKSDRSMPDCSHGDPADDGDTVYFSIVDEEGNACSYICSNYQMFGTGLVPDGCGFTLQNRGHGFSKDPNHLNVVAPNKRPFHTIIPAMVTDDKTGELLASYGVMGAFMQPQGHVQVLLNMVEFGMDPQRALDAPRIRVQVTQDGCLDVARVEDGIPEEAIKELQVMGHDVFGPIKGHHRWMYQFGRGHVITVGNWWDKWEGRLKQETGTKVLWAGSDPRGDGIAMAQI